MSNKRIDLTKDGLRKQILEHEEKYHKPNVEDVETILHCVEGIGLIAELKRCYELIDQAKANLKELFEVLLSGEVQDMVNYLESGGVRISGSHAEQDYAQGSGEVESTLGDGVPEWNAGPNM